MLDAAGVWPVPRRLPTSLVRLRVSPVCLSAGSDIDSQSSECEGSTTARVGWIPAHLMEPWHDPTVVLITASCRYLMPAVRLFVVAEDKAGLGRRPAILRYVPLRSWWVWKVAIAGISCRTELLPSIVPS
jgi:hypothetical protein